MATDHIGGDPPDETPGPSVPATGGPREGSTVEREEFVDSRTPEGDLVEEMEAAAAAEGAAIGGPAPDPGGAEHDEAMRPVHEAGGGEAEGFEQAEELLVENASHGDGGGDPLRDALRPEAESDRSGAVFGEGDEEKVSEVVEDPAEPDGPGEGPGITHER